MITPTQPNHASFATISIFHPRVEDDHFIPPFPLPILLISSLSLFLSLSFSLSLSLSHATSLLLDFEEVIALSCWFLSNSANFIKIRWRRLDFQLTAHNVLSHVGACWRLEVYYGVQLCVHSRSRINLSQVQHMTIRVYERDVLHPDSRSNQMESGMRDRIRPETHVLFLLCVYEFMYVCTYIYSRQGA